MLGIVGAAVRGIAARVGVLGLVRAQVVTQPLVGLAQKRCFGALSSIGQNWSVSGSLYNKSLAGSTENALLSSLLPAATPSRTVIKYSLRKGKRKSVKTVVKRFYRLNWGIWIRTCAGRHKKLWKKSLNRKRRLRQHVFCNATQSTMLDKMVTSYWKRPRYYVDDPYNPYHQRENFSFTRRKPLPAPLDD